MKPYNFTTFTTATILIFILCSCNGDGFLEDTCDATDHRCNNIRTFQIPTSAMDRRLRETKPEYERRYSYETNELRRFGNDNNRRNYVERQRQIYDQQLSDRRTERRQTISRDRQDRFERRLSDERRNSIQQRERNDERRFDTQRRNLIRNDEERREQRVNEHRDNRRMAEERNYNIRETNQRRINNEQRRSSELRERSERRFDNQRRDERRNIRTTNEQRNADRIRNEQRFNDKLSERNERRNSRLTEERRESRRVTEHHKDERNERENRDADIDNRRNLVSERRFENNRRILESNAPLDNRRSISLTRERRFNSNNRRDAETIQHRISDTDEKRSNNDDRRQLLERIAEVRFSNNRKVESQVDKYRNNRNREFVQSMANFDNIAVNNTNGNLFWLKTIFVSLLLAQIVANTSKAKIFG